MGPLQNVSNWFHPQNVQMKGQFGIRGAKSTLSLPLEQETTKQLWLLEKGLVCPQAVHVAPRLLELQEPKTLGLPAVPTVAPACGLLGDSQGAQSQRLLLAAFLQCGQRKVRLP